MRVLIFKGFKICGVLRNPILYRKYLPDYHVVGTTDHFCSLQILVVHDSTLEIH